MKTKKEDYGNYKWIIVNDDYYLPSVDERIQKCIVIPRTIFERMCKKEGYIKLNKSFNVSFSKNDFD
ncbi:MAG: hypothetical protein ACOCV1_04360 [Bacillota bacterium]